MDWISTPLAVVGVLLLGLSITVLVLLNKRRKTELIKEEDGLPCDGIIFTTTETVMVQPGMTGVVQIPCKGSDGSEITVEVCATGLPSGEIVRIPEGTELAAHPHRTK